MFRRLLFRSFRNFESCWNAPYPYIPATLSRVERLQDEGTLTSWRTGSRVIRRPGSPRLCPRHTSTAAAPRPVQDLPELTESPQQQHEVPRPPPARHPHRHPSLSLSPPTGSPPRSVPLPLPQCHHIPCTTTGNHLPHRCELDLPSSASRLSTLQSVQLRPHSLPMP